MNCPHCNQATVFRVKETRLADGDIVRTRCCNHCSKLFGTREVVDTTLPNGIGKGGSLKSQANIYRAHELSKVWK
jgi:transcriptional regulator NrdR family protein